MSIANLETEKLVKSHIRTAIKVLAPDAWVYMPVPGGMGMAGVPDFIMCLPTIITPEMVGQRHGMFVGLEAKKSNGKATKLQLKQLCDINKAAGHADIIRGSDDIQRSLSFMANKYGLQY